MDNIYLNKIAEMDSDAIVIEGFDDCIVGICNTFEGIRLLYSEKKIIEVLSKNMTVEQAVEYYEANILGAHFGRQTPVFLMDLEAY